MVSSKRDVDVVVRELRQVLQAPRTAPEWRWNAHRRLATASAAVGERALPVQTDGTADDLRGRLGALSDGALDRLGASAITDEVAELLEQLEHLDEG